MARASWTSYQGVGRLSLAQHSPAAVAAAEPQNHRARRRATHHRSHQSSHTHHLLGPPSTVVKVNQQALSLAQPTFIHPSRRHLQAMSMIRQTLTSTSHHSQKPEGSLGPLGPSRGEQILGQRQTSLQGQGQCTRRRHQCASASASFTATSSIITDHPINCPFNESSSPFRQRISTASRRSMRWPLHSTLTRQPPSDSRACSSTASADPGPPSGDSSSQEYVTHTAAPARTDTPDRAGGAPRAAPRASAPWRHSQLASVAAAQTDRLATAPSPSGGAAPTSITEATSPFAGEAPAATKARALLTRLAAPWQLPGLTTGHSAGAPGASRGGTATFSTSTSSLGSSQAQGMGASQVPSMPVQNQLVSVLFLLLPALLCYWLQLGLTRGLLTAGARSFVQLTAIGFVLRQIFESDSLYPIFGVVSVMVVIAGKTAAQRAKGVPNAMPVATFCILGAATMALSASVWLGVVPLKPRFVIPIAGIVVGSTMTIAANTMQRLADDMKAFRGQVEAALALGATPYQSCSGFVRRAIEVGVGPSIDYTKTIGLIQLPGAMTGMIMGGASVTEAVALQIVLTLVLLGTCTLCCILAAFLSSPQFFVGGSLRDHWTT